MTKKSKKMKLTCDGCGGKCCTYVAVEMEQPAKKSDFEDMVYYLHHDLVKVSVTEDDGERTWYLQFDGRCRYLTKDGRCEIYEHRPKVCREHDHDGCEHHEQEAFTEIASVRELLDYMSKSEVKKWRKWAGKLSQKLPPRLR